MQTLKYLNFEEKHRELVVCLENGRSLMHKLTSEKHTSSKEYISNVNHLRKNLAYASSLIYDKDNNFENYLAENDPALYYNVQSLILAVRMLKNMLDNLVETVRGAADS